MNHVSLDEAAVVAAPEPAISANGLALRGPKGPVFGPLDFAVEGGTVGAILGPTGSGRSCLILTLSGRMAASAGSLSVFGQPLPAAARRVIRQTAIAGVPAVDDLDDALSVRDMIRERVALLSSWRHRVASWGTPEMDELVNAVFGDHRPSVTQRVDTLSPLAHRQLQILLAMLAQPRLLLVDELDGFGDRESEQELWRRLGELAARGTTVIGASCPGAPLAGAAVLVNLDRTEVAA